MDKGKIVILLMMCLLMAAGMGHAASSLVDAKRTAGIEKKLKRNPGDMSLRCEYVGALLSQGDTARAEEVLDYGMRLGEAGCLYIHRARIAMDRKRLTQAAACCASAVGTGLLPDEEPLILLVDSMTRGGVAARLDKDGKANKSDYYALKGLGQIRLHDGDTLAALQCYQEAYRRGDTLLVGLIDSLKGAESVQSDSVVARIEFTRTYKKMEVTCKLNGLKIKAEVDTAATESSISGVETQFILKNEYVSKGDIVDNSVLIVRELDFGEGMLLRDVRLHHKRNQESPVVLCLADLRRLGNVVINEREKVLEVRR